MSDEPTPTTDPSDLEEIPVSGRGRQRVVISFRVPAEEAARISAEADRSGMTLSEFARGALELAASHWGAYGFGAPGAPSAVTGQRPQTGSAVQIDQPLQPA